MSRATPWHPQRRHHRSSPVIWNANTAWSASMRWPVTSNPRSSRRVNALRSGRSKIVLDMSRSFGWTVWESPSSKDLDPYPATTRPTPPNTPTPSNAKSTAVSMGGSNEFVECFCWGAVAEGGSGAVVQFVGDGVEVGLVAGDGAPLARETMFSVVAWGLARGEARSALCVSVYRCLISLMLSFVNQWCSSS